MMRYRLGILLLVVSVCGLPTANAAPVDYKINFTAEEGSAPISGSFTYDGAIPTFTNFFVEWEGAFFNLTPSANNPLISGVLSCLGGATHAAASFALLSDDCNASAQVWAIKYQDPGHSIIFQIFSGFGIMGIIDFQFTSPLTTGAIGTWSIEAATVPEPASLTLSLSALLALAFVGRKRLAASCGPSN
jgi:hypothetical protein